MSLRLALVSALLLLTACTPRPEGDDDDATDDPDADLPILPDPGDAVDDWGLNIGFDDEPCCGTPEEAHPVGTVTMDAGYIQGVIDSELAFYYVFRTSSELTEFTFPMYFESVHLHDGDGLRFRGEVEPSSSEEWAVTWEVEPNHVYVIEIASEFEGFF